MSKTGQETLLDLVRAYGRQVVKRGPEAVERHPFKILVKVHEFGIFESIKRRVEEEAREFDFVIAFYDATVLANLNIRRFAKTPYPAILVVDGNDYSNVPAVLANKCIHVDVGTPKTAMEKEDMTIAEQIRAIKSSLEGCKPPINNKEDTTNLEEEVALEDLPIRCTEDINGLPSGTFHFDEFDLAAFKSRREEVDEKKKRQEEILKQSEFKYLTKYTINELIKNEKEREEKLETAASLPTINEEVLAENKEEDGAGIPWKLEGPMAERLIQHEKMHELYGNGRPSWSEELKKFIRDARKKEIESNVYMCNDHGEYSRKAHECPDCSLEKEQNYKDAMSNCLSLAEEYGPKIEPPERPPFESKGWDKKFSL